MNDVVDLNYLKVKQEKKLNEYRAQGLPVDKLRRLLDALYDGEPTTMLYLTKIRSFYSKKANLHREHCVYMWMVRNNIVGKRLVEFFENEEGFLNGMNVIINRMEGRVYSLDRIKIDEAL